MGGIIAKGGGEDRKKFAGGGRLFRTLKYIALCYLTVIRGIEKAEIQEEVVK